MQRLQPDRFEGQWQGLKVGLFTLAHPSGMSVSVCNWGAKVLQWCVPNRQGRLIDICLGYDDLTSLLSGSPSMGAFIGRYAGRIANAAYEWNGQPWVLGANDGPHSLHGGPAGSRFRVFKVLSHTPDRLTLGLRFASEIDGHPGVLNLTVTYRWSDAGGLLIEHHVAHVSGPSSPVSLTPQAQTSDIARDLRLKTDPVLVRETACFYHSKGLSYAKRYSIKARANRGQVARDRGQDWPRQGRAHGLPRGWGHRQELLPVASGVWRHEG